MRALRSDGGAHPGPGAGAQRPAARTGALFLAYPPATLAPSGAPAHAAGPTGPLPLRYRLVDKLNDTVKRGLPVVHIAAKKAGPLLRKLK